MPAKPRPALIASAAHFLTDAGKASACQTIPGRAERRFASALAAFFKNIA
jgi:hypothetical protein